MIRAVLDGFQSKLWTAIPAIIESFDPDKETCTAQPAIQARVRDKDGSYSWVNLPLLVDVPVMFPGGGGYTLTFPVAKGDEALIVFSSRCIDFWWETGRVEKQAELRMHDLSDGFAFVGVKSQPRTLSGGVSTSGAQLRSDDGQTKVSLNGSNVAIVCPGRIDMTAPAGVYMNGKRIDVHVHGGVDTGPSNTGNNV